MSLRDTSQTIDYADSPMTASQKGSLEEAMSYWRERFADMPVAAELPTDRPRPVIERCRLARHLVRFSQHLSESLEALSEREGATLFELILAGVQLLISRHTSQSDIVVGCVIASEEKIRAESIDFLAEPLVIRTDLTGDPSFRELLGRVAASVRDVSKYKVPFAYLLEQLGQERDLIKNPLFRVLLSEATSPLFRKCERHDAFQMPMNLPPLDLQVQLYKGPDGIVTCFAYESEFFDATSIDRLARQFETLLEGATADPNVSVSRLPLLTSAERQQLLVEWNDTEAEYPKDRCVHQLFEEQVAATPNATAVVFEDQELSYGELNNRANRLAAHLMKLGVEPDSLVGICVHRSPDMVAGLLSIWKAGGAYVPLDPRYPPDRLSLMVEDSGLSVLVTEKALQHKFPEYKGQLFCIDSEVICEERVEYSGWRANPENLAYVIYTSGSTGKPKGVQVCHRSLVNFLVSMRLVPGLAKQDTLLAVTTISFDIAALELYLPLIVGAKLVLASRETAIDGYKLKRTLETARITVMQATPATWRLVLEAGWQGSDHLKILCGGEALPRDLAMELLKRTSSVWNMYGPTETTVWSTVSRIVADNGPITIGKPIANTEVYILDSHLEPVPVGVPGELYIGGAGVARGYLHRPELTAEKFIKHPFRGQASDARLYRTGDLARFRANGELECLGRIDNQVKLRGFRIELGEIESILSQYPGVKQAVVVAREDTLGDERLVAYATLHPGQSLLIGALREFLKQRLPEYMLPSQFEVLGTLPLTPNGKVDRKALPKPGHPELSPRAQVAPRDSTEAQLVRIWEAVLGVRGIGVTENFFDLGGHSLLVAKLLRRIEQTFGKKLSMAAIFEAPTVERQSFLLCNASGPQWPSAVIPVQPTGSKRPFFCFGFRAGPVFLPLARCLGPDQPLLAVDPTLLEISELSPPFDMESIAATVVNQIRRLQPEGPYHLSGFCAGGLIVYEVANQLVSQGQQVALLALFEPQLPSDYAAHKNGFRVRSLGQRLMFHFRNVQQFKHREGRTFVLYRAKVFLRRMRGLVHRPGRDDLTAATLPNDVNGMLDFACRMYQPRHFPGQITLFQATERPFERSGDRQYWKDLAAAIAVHEIPGDWNWATRFFVAPNVEIVAKRIRHCLPNGLEEAREWRPSRF